MAVLGRFRRVRVLAALPREVPAAIKRLMDEVRRDEATAGGCFDRAHNRHNRSSAAADDPSLFGGSAPEPHPPDSPIQQPCEPWDDDDSNFDGSDGDDGSDGYELPD